MIMASQKEINPTNNTVSTIAVPNNDDSTITHQTSPHSHTNTVPFVFKLHKLLDDVQQTGLEDVVSWSATGKSFKIHQPSVFETEVLPKYYFAPSNTSTSNTNTNVGVVVVTGKGKFKSFQRQLNVYGFKTIKMGKEKGGYFHPHFIRGQLQHSLSHVVRKQQQQQQQQNQQHHQQTQVKGHRLPRRQQKGKISKENHLPQHQNMNSNHNHTTNNIKDKDTDTPFEFESGEIDSFYNFFYPTDPNEKGFIEGFLSKEDQLADHESKTTSPPTSKTTTTMIRNEILSKCTLEDCDDDESNALTENIIDTFSFLLDDVDIGINFNNGTKNDDDDDDGDDCDGEHDVEETCLAALLNDAMMMMDDTEDTVCEASDDCSDNAESCKSKSDNDISSDNKNDADGYDITTANFPVKLYALLENAVSDNYEHIVSWTMDGKSFKVHNHKEFVNVVMPLYFNQSKYESFRRMLNLYNFSRVPKGPQRGIISHPLFQRGGRREVEQIHR